MSTLDELARRYAAIKRRMATNPSAAEINRCADEETAIASEARTINATMQDVFTRMLEGKL